VQRWQQRAWVGVGLALLSLAGVGLCWWWHAHWFWWCLSMLGTASALIEILADLNAIHDLRKRIKQNDFDT
jgi:cyanate permease